MNEAKSLLKEGGDVIKPLYEYWINKRKKLVRKCEAYLTLLSHIAISILYCCQECYTYVIIGNEFKALL